MERKAEPRIILRHAQSRVWAVCLCGWHGEKFDTRRAFRVNAAAYQAATQSAWDSGIQHFEGVHG